VNTFLSTLVDMLHAYRHSLRPIAFINNFLGNNISRTFIDRQEPIINSALKMSNTNNIKYIVVVFNLNASSNHKPLLVLLFYIGYTAK